MEFLDGLLDNYADEVRKEQNTILDGGWSGIEAHPDRVRNAIKKYASRVAHLESILPLLITLRKALGTLPMNSLGEGRSGQMIWPIRDELINDLTLAIRIMEDQK